MHIQYLILFVFVHPEVLRLLFEWKFQATAKVEFPDNPYAEENFEFFDQRLLDAVQNNEPLVHDFFKILALCHTVMPEVKGKQHINHHSKDTDTCIYQTYCICESFST